MWQWECDFRNVSLAMSPDLFSPLRKKKVRWCVLVVENLRRSLVQRSPPFGRKNKCLPHGKSGEKKKQKNKNKILLRLSPIPRSPTNCNVIHSSFLKYIQDIRMDDGFNVGTSVIGQPSMAQLKGMVSSQTCKWVNWCSSSWWLVEAHRNSYSEGLTWATFPSPPHPFTAWSSNCSIWVHWRG